MTEENVKREEMDKKKRKANICLAGICIGSALIGSKWGVAVDRLKQAKGLEEIFKRDPELKERMANVITGIYKERMMK